MVIILARRFLVFAFGLFLLSHAAKPASAQQLSPEEIQSYNQMVAARNAGHIAEAVPFAEQALAAF
jgi:hypothetical protein